jgi:hypothetical protein
MRVGIVTFHNARNYGAILQAYALQTVVEQLGHTAEIVDYAPRDFRNQSLFLPWSNAKNVVGNLFALLRYPQLKRRNGRMAAFCRQHLHTSARVYISSGELESSLSDYDAFICGSDQVWKPTPDRDRNRAYYLGFVRQDQARKIAYAPSFGVSSVATSFEQEISPWISDIPSLSVREETGNAIIRKATGRQAQVVLDPTLLLTADHWRSLSLRLSIESPYILVYTTSQRGLFSDLVRHVKKTTKLPVVVLAINPVNLIPGTDRLIYDTSPQQFIDLFANAACVCTNSFHGTAFSVIHRRPFWGVPHNASNSRIADLLHRLDLSGRQVRSVAEFPKAPLEIDYTKAGALLDEHRKDSINFLKTAMEHS